jgi:hypothetical protein
MTPDEAQRLIQNADAFTDTFIGTNTSHLGIERNVGIPDRKRLMHVLSTGPTGSGKTQVMIHAALQDAHKGNGFCFINPKGGAIDQILEKLPDDRVNDVVYISPGADEATPINVLEPHGVKDMTNAQRENQKEIIVSDLVDLFRRFSESWGDRFGRILETLLRAHLDLNIYHNESNTLVDVYNCVVENGHLTELIDRTRDPVTRKQLVRIKEDMGSYEMEPLQRRLNDFMMKTVRDMIGAKKSGINFRDAIDDNTIILADLQKGEVGDTVAHIIGSIIITKVWAAAQSRITVQSHRREPYNLYVDELQNFAGEGSNFAKILSEAREYGLGCWLATQYMQNLDETAMRRAVANNCRTKIIFDPSGDDDLARLANMLNGIDRDRLTNLPNFRAAVQIPSRDRVKPAVVVDTYPPWSGDRDVADVKNVKRRAARRSVSGRSMIADGPELGQGANAGGDAHTELLGAAKHHFEEQYGWIVQLLYQDAGDDKPDGTILAGDEIKHLEAECGTLSKPIKVLHNVERAHAADRDVVFITAGDNAQKLANILQDPVNRRGEGDGQDDEGTYAYYRDDGAVFDNVEIVPETEFKIFAVSESGGVYPFGTDREATCPMLGDYSEDELTAFCLHRDDDGFCEKLGEPCVLLDG